MPSYNPQLPDFVEPLWLPSLFRIEAKTDLWTRLEQEDANCTTELEEVSQITTPTSDDALLNIKRSKKEYSVHELRDKARQCMAKNNYVDALAAFEKYIIKRTNGKSSLNSSVVSSITTNSSSSSQASGAPAAVRSDSVASQRSSREERNINLSFNSNSLKIYVVIGCNLAVEYTLKGNISTAIDVLSNTIEIISENIKKLQKRASSKNDGRMSRSNSRSSLTGQVSDVKSKLKEDKDQLNFMKAILAFNLTNLLIRKKKYASALSFSKIALKKFSYYGNSEFASFFMLTGAVIHCLLKNYQDAQNILVDCLILIRYMKYHKGREYSGGSGSIKIAWIYIPASSPDSMSEDDTLSVARAGDVFQQNWESMMKILSYHNLALCKAYFQAYGKAVKLSDKAIELAKAIPNIIDVGSLVSTLAKTFKFCKRMGETASAYAGNILVRVSAEPEQVLQTLKTVTDVKKKLVSLLPFLGKSEDFKDLNISVIEDEDDLMEQKQRVSSSQSSRSTQSEGSEADKFLLKSSLKNTIIAARHETSSSLSQTKKRIPQKSPNHRVILPPVKRVLTSLDMLNTHNTNQDVNKRTNDTRKAQSAPKQEISKRKEKPENIIKADEVVADIVSIMSTKQTTETMNDGSKQTITFNTPNSVNVNQDPALTAVMEDPTKMAALLKLQKAFRKKLARNRAKKIKLEKENALRDFLAEERRWFEENKDKYFDLLLEDEK
ncbi:hypothetical protein C9374_008026 [Naegleria lovaniensis]|uniref:Uncharacterized protein n=1 Tax=Naegleria lovaniensis TaxID=51637 RepID=A0AA88GMC2_NAELO|nr:uncharacterized protein C9374_008026 [Naegleria lovaniensis]KAG2378878.1 hypothetical protein C9374_008026 [Naegleria lovaniensis]